MLKFDLSNNLAGPSIFINDCEQFADKLYETRLKQIEKMEDNPNKEKMIRETKNLRIKYRENEKLWNTISDMVPHPK